jgi:hypothetical protein
MACSAAFWPKLRRWLLWNSTGPAIGAPPLSQPHLSWAGYFCPGCRSSGQRDPFGGAGGSPRRSRTNPLGVAATPDGDQTAVAAWSRPSTTSATASPTCPDSGWKVEAGAPGSKGSPSAPWPPLLREKLGEVLALVGSSGWVEIVQNRGNASRALDFKVGDEVRVQWILTPSPLSRKEGDPRQVGFPPSRLPSE